jgi:beta-galactosidase
MVLIYACEISYVYLKVIFIQPGNIGSYSPCDRDYTSWLRDFILQHLGKDVVLFSTDGDGDGYLQCGKIPVFYII